MEVELRHTPQRTEPILVLEVPALTPEVEALFRSLRAPFSPSILGYRDGQAFPLSPEALTLFYAQDKAVYARDTSGAVYALRLRLYELEGQLDSRTFVRVSNSEIVNLKQVTALDLSLSGTIKLTLTGGGVSWVSRRNVKNIKKALGL